MTRKRSSLRSRLQTAANQKLTSRFYGEREIVAPRLPVPTDGTEPVRFGDDVWDFRGQIQLVRSRRASCRFHFEHLKHPSLRLALKEFVCARLRLRHGRHKVWKIDTALNWLSRARPFVIFCEELGISSLRELREEHLAAWRDRVLSMDLNPAYARDAVLIPRDLWEWRNSLTEGAMTLRPYGEDEPRTIAPIEEDSLENRTARIPEGVMAPFLAWCLRYVNDFAPDILAEVERFKRSQALRSASPPLPPRGSRRTLLERYFKRLQKEGRGLPDFGPKGNRRLATPRSRALGRLAYVNLQQICQDALGSADASWLRYNREIVRPWLRRLGLASDVARRKAPESLIGLRGTIAPLNSDLSAEIRRLQTACYVIIGFLSGMRDSELLSLTRGCASTEYGVDGSPIRHRLHGRVYKHRGETGDPEQWVVIEPVVRAVAVLESLQTALDVSAGVPLLASLSVVQNRGCLWNTAGPDMNNLRNVCNRLASRSHTTPAVPRHDAKPWRFTSGQLRRTLAWYIVNEPFGTIAGAIQYKHASIRIMEGYGGSAAAGFRDELEREKARRTLSLAMNLYEDRAEGRQTGVGGGATQLDAQLDAIHAEFAGTVVDEHRLLQRLKSVAAQLHCGFLNDCFYTGDGLCKSFQKTPGVPVFARCQPDYCQNARIGPEHRAPWEMARDNAAALLDGRRKLRVLQEEVVQNDYTRYARVVRMLDDLISRGDYDGPA